MVGAFGYFLNYVLKEAGLKRTDVALLNTTLCRPPFTMKAGDYNKAIQACKPRLQRELQIINPNVVFAIGAASLYATTGLRSINGWYGAPIAVEGETYQVFPSSFAFRNPAMHPVFKRWVKTAKGLADGTVKPFKWNRLITAPPYEPYLEELLAKAIRGETISIDIENNPSTKNIRVLGLGTDELAVSVPLLSNPTEGYPATSDRTFRLIRQILAAPCPKLGHNMQHDVLELTEAGFELNGEIEDTLLMHAVVAPQLSHKLTDVAAFEFHAERWKTKFGDLKDEKGSKDVFWATVPLKDLLPYNAKDVQGTSIAKNLLWPQVLRTHNGVQLYNTYRILENLAMRMRQRGIKVDISKFDGHRQNLNKIMDECRVQFAAFQLPPEFQLGANGQHRSLNKLFFEVFELPSFSQNKKTGSDSLDGKALQRYATDTSLNPLIQNVARTVLKYRKYGKLLTSYIDNLKEQLDEKSTCHPVWRPWGTRTNRWAANDPALQTIPGGLKDLFQAREGRKLAKADASQLELRIVAYLAGDKKLLEWYAKGEDVHTLNAIEIFQVVKPTKQQRDLAKRVVYGLNYGGSAETIWRSLLVDFPGLALAHVIKVMDGWYRGHPEIKKWQEEEITKARKLLYVEAPLSGRRLYFHDARIEPTKVVNHPVQTTAGDLMNLAIQKVDELLDWNGGEAILAQVHDEILLEGPEPMRLVGILKKAMEAPVKLNGYDAVFPVDCAIGNNWANMEKVKQC